jgi:hypothetical protein
MVGWILPGKDTCPGGAAYLAGGIAPGELHPFLGNSVDIRGFVKCGPFIGEVAGTEVVHQNENYIWLAGE